MNKLVLFYPVISLLLLAGCTSNDRVGEEQYMSEREQKAALARTKTPQYFGYNAFPAEGGIGFRGTARLHPNHQAEMSFKNNQPVFKIRGRSPRMTAHALMDFSSATTWMEYSKSQEFGATFMGMNEDVIPYRGSFSGDVNAYAAVVSQMRIDQLFIENIPVYVRMATGALGPFARGIYDPNVDIAFGYDILGLFQTIQLDMRRGNVILSSSHPYSPHEDLLMSKTRIVTVPGYGLTVEGAIFGQSTPIVLDPAGDYHFMRADKKVAQTKQVSLGDVVYRKVPTMQLPASGLPRAGRLMLEKYLITICPGQGVVYFERYPE